jgi:superfamily II DNA or RNA helicase
VNVIFPRILRIDVNENGNSIQQFAAPSWAESAAVKSIKDKPTLKNSKSVLLITPDSGCPPIAVLGFKSTSMPEHDCIIRINEVPSDCSAVQSLDLSRGEWVKHPRLIHPKTLADHERIVSETRETWRDAFNYRREDIEQNTKGLRPPQIGAIYAVQSHWSVNSDLATVVIPTGVGKTETMLSVLVAERCQRLLVIVPSDALRTQLAEKFLSFGLLKTSEFQVINERAEYPVVGVLRHRPDTPDEVKNFFRKCNVIVTTMPLASQCQPDVMTEMALHCPALFIDEAHHVAARKWKEFRDVFSKSRVIQFTATPFRTDDKPVDGKRIFDFSLRKAQEQNYFKQIEFKPVIEFDPEKKDSMIAEAAVEQLRVDEHLGHILMARVANVTRANEVFQCYQKYSEFNPVQIHTGITSKSERDAIRQKLVTGHSRIVVCVDMLGEGFDLPELKIAAFHDIRKSLAVTLQLAGRFTREKPHLGNATFIANIAEIDVKEELRRLYQHDSDWNVLLPTLSKKANDGEFDLSEFLGGFQGLPDDITLRNIQPAMSTVVYKTKCKAWTPENFDEGIVGFDKLDKVYHTLHPLENTLVVVTTRKTDVEWAQIDAIHTWDWQLYILHWDQARGLLFIHNSNNAGFFKKLAKAVAGEVEQFCGQNVFRCLKLQNVGLLEQRGRQIRFTMRAGSDVETGMSQAQKEKAIKSNLFGQGYENGQKATIGCSYKGRIWSYKTTNLLEFRSWCFLVGSKLIDNQLNPQDVLNGTLIPEFVGKRPLKMPITIEWPDEFLREPEGKFTFRIDGEKVYPWEMSIDLVSPSLTGLLEFKVSADGSGAGFELALSDRGNTTNYLIRPAGKAKATISFGSRLIALEEYFDEHPPVIWFADGSCLKGNEYVELRKRAEPFDRGRIEEWDWTGTSIRKESQGPMRDATAVQFRVIAEQKRKAFTVIMDDDDSGESADVVAITEQASHIEIEFWHCKFSTEDNPGHRVKELYEVCGQAQKSIRWLERPKDLCNRLMKRSAIRFRDRQSTRYEQGSDADLIRIREKVDSQRVSLRINIVQPGLSKALASLEQLELLAVTENYLMETFQIPFGVIASC